MIGIDPILGAAVVTLFSTVGSLYLQGKNTKDKAAADLAAELAKTKAAQDFQLRLRDEDRRDREDEASRVRARLEEEAATTRTKLEKETKLLGDKIVDSRRAVDELDANNKQRTEKIYTELKSNSANTEQIVQKVDVIESKADEAYRIANNYKAKFDSVHSRIDDLIHQADRVSDEKIDEKIKQVKAVVDDNNAVIHKVESIMDKSILPTVSASAHVSITADGIIRIWDKPAEDLLGWTDVDLIGKNIIEIIPERYKALHMAGMKRVLSGGPHVILEKTISLPALHKSGTEVILLMVINQTRNAGGEIIYRASLRADK